MTVSEPTGPTPVLASHAERDEAAQRLQVAFAEHRLDESEFDQRIRQALTARTTAELAGLVADLPAPVPASTVAAGKPGKFAVAMKSSISRAGRWTVPRRFYSLVYKGGGLIDLRAAELTAPVTTVLAVSYKSRTTILLPPGVRAEPGGLGVSLSAPAGTEPATLTPGQERVVRVKGVAYKGAIEVAS